MRRNAGTYDGYRERRTILPPPPEVSFLDTRASAVRTTWLPDYNVEGTGEADNDTDELREPTDVDGTRWWEEGDGHAITEPLLPRFLQAN